MYNPQEIEKQILNFWEDKNIYRKLKKRNSRGKKFYFLQGPPYTSGKIHLGHAWNYSLKDSILRYKRMQGFNVWDRDGYDMHGLPTERAVQKQLKIKDKKEIEKYGVDKFINKCRDFSLTMMQQMIQDFKNLGVWLDFENPYMPIANDFMEAEWYLIKKAYRDKRLYQGEKVMTWCASCETSLAKHELEYKNVTDKSIFFKFKIKNTKNEYLILWSTTPWTIAFNLGVMVNPKLDYVKAEVGDEIWILAKDLAASVIHKFTDSKLKVLEEFKGEKLKGLRYEHPFYDTLKRHYDNLIKKHPAIFTVVLSEQYVDASSGTGLVHMAPGSGPEDYEVGKKNNIPPFNNLDEKGNYSSNMGEFSSLNARKDNEKFIEALEKRNSLIATTPIEHYYPHCWRCKQPVIFKITKQWFFKIEDLVPKMLKDSKKVNWIPKNYEKVYQLWIENLKDNGITRQRYWGTPMPLWQCNKCKEKLIIGSIKELKQHSKDIPKDLHKPYIDKITFKCKCSGVMKRTQDILDVWLDSGTTSFNCLYNNKKLIKKYFPADLILEATEQTRLWFYMLQLVSTIMYNKTCYKNVYMHGMVRDIEGVKMSKSLGNIVSPYEITNKYGADTFRFYFTSMNSGEDVNFSWEEVKIKHRNLNILLNTSFYLLNYSNAKKQSKLQIEDKWIFSRLHSTIKEVTELLDNYKIDQIVTPLENLFLDLSREYIQFTRERIDEKTVINTIKQVLLETLKMFSIVSPFISEKIYQDLKLKFKSKKQSIFLESWPKYNPKKINKKLEQNMQIVKEMTQEILAQREKAQIGIRWPLKEAKITTTKNLSNFKNLIKKQTNIKQIKFSKGKTKISLNTEITKGLEQEGFTREIIRRIQDFRKRLGLKKQDKINLSITTDYPLIKKEIKQKTNSLKLDISKNPKKYKHSIKETIKNKEFTIYIHKI